ncbi:MAG: HD domain-containing protein [Candidatus Krumholzibacteriota bacterium]|nr:HD domain-containing protein [Candidatus Krumholzibacteriota bacterium]
MDAHSEISLGREFYEWENALLAECGLFLVGGAVRDILLGTGGVSVDTDYLVSGIDPPGLLDILNRFGRTDLVGKSFGVIKFTPDRSDTVDISFPRKEESTGPGHRDFSVRFDPDIPVEEDLVRRDYTVNSIALDLGKGQLVDPLGGREDLEKRLLRVNRNESFIEDPLRILRGVQFMTRFGLSVEKDTERLMRKYADTLKTVSMERIRLELNKMMTYSERPGDGFLFMHETGILPYILPELEDTWGIEQNEFHIDDIFVHSVKCCNLADRNIEVRWAALLHDLGKKKMKKTVDDRVVFYGHEFESSNISKSILNRLVFPNSFVKYVSHLVLHHMFYITDEWSDAAVRRFIAKVGLESLDDLFALRMADGSSKGDDKIASEVEISRKRVDAVISAEAVFKRKDLAINGSDIIRMTGESPGRKIGSILGEILDMVLEDPDINTAERLEAIVRERYRPARRDQGTVQ